MFRGTRSDLVGPMAEDGVKFLHIGVNSASTPPDVPDLFVWKDRTGATLTVMYQHKGYGGVVRIPGSDLAVAIEMADDNAGPHSIEEIRKIYADLRAQFPGAKITASNLSEIANAVDPYREQFPVVTDEIGDTWIHGVPQRSGESHAVSRDGAAAAGVDRGRTSRGRRCDGSRRSAQIRVVGEHTWGTDTKTYLDHDHYKPATWTTCWRNRDTRR